MLVADLLKQSVFPDFKLAGGSAGLSREISSVSVIDAPDVDRWMRGGEFLVGSGYIFKNDPRELIPFMMRAAEKNVAAFGLKLDRFHHNLPEEIVRVADELSVPFMRIPLRYRWTDINETVYSQLEREKASRLSQGSLAVDDLADSKAFLSRCAVLLGRTIVVTSNTLCYNHAFFQNGRVAAASSLDERISPPASESRQLPSRGRVTAHVEYREQNHDWQAVYSLTGSYSLTVRILLAADEICPSAAQERVALRVISLLRAESYESESYQNNVLTARDRFFEGLCMDVYTDAGMIEANLNEMRILMPSAARVVIAVSNESVPFNGWTPPESILGYRMGHTWTFLAPLGERPGDKYERRFIEELTCDGREIFFALGGVVNRATEISRSYRDALGMVGIIRSSALPSGAYLYEEFHLYSLLDNICRLPEAESVWKRYWQPLIAEGDEWRSLSRLELAQALIASDWNAKLCAKNLHLHYNTVRNYIDRFEDVLGVKIANQHHRLGIQLAYYIDRSRNKR